MQFIYVCVCLCVVVWNIHYFKLFTDTSTHKSLIQLHTHSCATMILINISRFYGCSLFGESAFCFFLSNSVIFLSSCCFALPSVSRYFFSSFAMATFELNNDSFFSLCLLSLVHCTKTFDLFIDNEWIAHSLFVFHFRKHSAIIQMEYAFNLQPGNRRYTLRVSSCHLGMICVFLSAFSFFTFFGIFRFALAVNLLWVGVILSSGRTRINTLFKRISNKRISGTNECVHLFRYFLLLLLLLHTFNFHWFYVSSQVHTQKHYIQFREHTHTHERAPCNVQRWKR